VAPKSHRHECLKKDKREVPAHRLTPFDETRAGDRQPSALDNGSSSFPLSRLARYPASKPAGQS
jgi:hypothetical protein